MANRVQIVITVDAAQAGAAIGKVDSALRGMGATATRATDRGTRGFQKFESQGLLKAVLGANLLERAILRVSSVVKAAVVDSTLLTARADVLDRVMEQLAGTSGSNIEVIRAQVAQMKALGIETIKARQSAVQFITAELDTADAVRLANVARDRAVIAGENTSDTMERLTRAVLAQEVELLKMVGIVIRQEDAFKRYAAQIGKSANDLTELERRQAFVNEILRFGEGSLGAYESAMEKAGKQLTSLPRLAREAGVALGRNFQDELLLGVQSAREFFEFIERNAAELVAMTKAAVALTAALGLLKIAMSEVALINLGLFFTNLIGGLGKLGGAITTVRLLLAGAGGVTGLVGALGLLGAAAAAAGFAVGELLGIFARSRELERVVGVDFERARERLAALGVEVKNLAEVQEISARLAVVNAARRKEGLEPLRANAELVAQLDAEEKRLRRSTDQGTDSLEKRAAAVEKLNEQLEKRRFALSLTGLGEADTIRARAAREIEQLLEKAREFPEVAANIEATIAGINEATDIKLDQLRAKQRDESAKFLLEALDRNLGAIEKIEQARDSELAKARAIAEKFPELRDLAARAEVEIAEDAMRKIADARGREARQAEEFVRNLERQAALAEADAFERIAIERAGRLEEIERDLNLSQEQIERAREAINRDANAAIRAENQRVADEQLRAWERNASEYGRFLDRMVRFTEQSGSFLKNIWRAISDEFQRSVTKMVLSWLFGLRQLQGATAGARGGILGTLLGGIFGGVGAAPVSAQTPPFVNNAFPGAATVGTTAAGSIPGAVPPGAAQAAGIALPGGQGPLLGLLLGLSVASGGRPGAGALAGLGGVLGGVALSGAAAGAAGGIGALAGAGVGLAGFLTNPIGLALLGGIAGVSALVGIFQRGRKKEQAADIANEGFAKIDEQIQLFELRQSSFERTVSAMNQIWQQMVSAWESIGGKIGQRSIADQRRFFEERLQRVEDLQRRRNERADLIAGLPIPEFQSGGLVPEQRAPILAALHPGEFVLSRDAVQRIGTPKLEQVNQGGEGLGDITVVIQTPDKSGVEEMLRANASEFQRFVKAVVRRARREGDLGFAT